MGIPIDTQQREFALQTFLARLAEAFDAAKICPASREALDHINTALSNVHEKGLEDPERLPVCEHLTDALDRAKLAARPFAALAEAFCALEPSLTWKRRHAGGPFASDNWPDGHANTTILGPNGLEHRTDLLIGASLLAPHVRYPDHNHGPEEVYLVLSPGRFQHGESGWFEPGIGGTLYNVPNIRHAMASDDVPLLAFWCLRTEPKSM